MLHRLLTLLTVLTLACASAHAYVPERSLLHAGELASPAKAAPRGFAATAATAAKEKSRASDCCIRENWHPPLKLASSMQFTGHYREREGTAYYAQQRYYRPGLGRFNRVDPWEGDVLRPITLNKYLYANGHPLLYVDPDGRCGMQLGDDFCELGAAIANGWNPEQYHDHLKVRAQAERDASDAGINLTKGIVQVGLEGLRDTFNFAMTAGRMQYDMAAAREVAGTVNGTIEAINNPGQTYAAASAAFGAGLDEQHRLMAAGDRAGAWEVRGRLAAPFVYALAPLVSRGSQLSSSAATSRVQRAQAGTVVEGGDGLPRVDLNPGSSSIHSVREARRLEGENRGAIFVREPQRPGAAGEFESGADGAFSVVDQSRSRVVPALRFDNPNARGNNFVRFDGYEDGGRTLIDRKIQLTTKTKEALNNATN
jgi:RHS repeat-associated protein